MNLKNVLDIASRSDPGRVRSNNEDCIGHDPALGVVALADGMGGPPGGDIASAIAVNTVLQYLKAILARLPADESDAPTRHVEMSSATRQAIISANEMILETAQAQPEYRGMGTTLVLVIFCDDLITVANVGDSRLYRFRDDRLEQITKDHSLVQTLVDKGLCTQEQARTSPNRNILTRAVGTEPAVNVDVFENTLMPNDTYLLCSDGLNNMIEDTDICQIVRTFGADLDETAEQLIARANENGGKDNISVILVKPQQTCG